jgi:hypothetical protein
MIPTLAITPELADEFARGVGWLREHVRPELTVEDALAEAIEDWLAGLRAEHLRGQDVPGFTRDIRSVDRDLRYGGVE